MLIKDLPDDEIEAACELFRRVFAAEITPEVWRWKYRGEALLGHINLVAYDDAGALVGHAGAVVLPGVGPGVDHGAARAMIQVCDVMVAAHRRGGTGPEAVYPALMRALRAAIDARFPGAYAYGFPGKRPFLLGARLGFYRRIEDIREYDLPTDSAPRNGFAWSIRELDGREAEAVCNRLRAPCDAAAQAPTVVRDARYLRWRYLEHPTKTYTLLGVKRFWRTLGAWVVAVEGDALRVVDTVMDESLRPRGLAMLRAWAGRRGFARVLCWRPAAEGLPGADTGIVAMQFELGERAELEAPEFMPGDLDIF